MTISVDEHSAGNGDDVLHEDDPFELDITFIENGPEANALLVASTSDNCGSSCPNACTTSVY